MNESPPARVAVLARAKVNLYLHVLGRRPDGYHLLDSLVVFADVGDRIEVAAAESLRLAIDGPFAAEVPAGDDNLVLRAARALAQAVGRPAAAAIRLTKSLPVASGIGGGSADAAATLRALVRLWRLDIDGERLRRLALALGADVPMCLRARPVFVGGIGERIEEAPELPPCALLLVNPRVALPTPRGVRATRGPVLATGAVRDTGGRRARARGEARRPAQRPDGGGDRPGAGDRFGARRAAGDAWRSARAHERQRRHLLRPVRRRSGGGIGGARAGRAASGVVDHRRVRCGPRRQRLRSRG